jgi:hypothetical protein
MGCRFLYQFSTGKAVDRRQVHDCRSAAPIPGQRGLLMGRYYFHISAGLDSVHDDEGLELKDDEEARLEALRAIVELREEEPDRDWTSCYLEVVDSAGNVILRKPFAASEPDSNRQQTGRNH